MSSHLKNRSFLERNNPNKNLFLPVLLLILIIAVFSISWTREILFSAGSPLWSLKNSVTSFVTENINLLNSKEELIKQNLLLEQQIKSSEQNVALNYLLRKENDDLKNILDRKKGTQNLLLSSVLVKPFLSPYDTLIIDVGSSSGITINDKVLADGNTYIGYVSDVYDNTSKVVLYSSPGQKVKVLMGNNNVEKEAVGQGGGNFKVQLPRESDVKEGDSITFPSISTNIFGVVEKVEFKESDTFQSVLFKNPANIAELKWVEVILSPKK